MEVMGRGVEAGGALAKGDFEEAKDAGWKLGKSVISTVGDISTLTHRRTQDVVSDNNNGRPVGDMPVSSTYHPPPPWKRGDSDFKSPNLEHNNPHTEEIKEPLHSSNYQEDPGLKAHEKINVLAENKKIQDEVNRKWHEEHKLPEHMNLNPLAVTEDEKKGLSLQQIIILRQKQVAAAKASGTSPPNLVNGRLMT